MQDEGGAGWGKGWGVGWGVAHFKLEKPCNIAISNILRQMDKVNLTEDKIGKIEYYAAILLSRAFAIVLWHLLCACYIQKVFQTCDTKNNKCYQDLLVDITIEPPENPYN